jgi:hypothetical protein
MEKFSEGFSLLLVVILATSSLMMVEPAFAQTPTSSPVPIPKPSIPEFSVKFIDLSYTTPTTYSIDPNTGQNVTYLGSYVANKTFEVTIKNQPFAPYFIPYLDTGRGWYISLHYNIRIKAHNEENWTNLYLREDIPYLSENVPSKSASEYTVLSYNSYQPISENTYIMGGKKIDFPPGSQVDFQVEALAGYIQRTSNPNPTSQLDMYPYVFTGESSGWGSTQTVAIPETSTSTSPKPNPTPTPTVPEFSLLVVIPLIIGVFAIVVIFRHRKPISQNKPNVKEKSIN